MFLVTGGTGFLGQHLVQYLARKAERVRSLDVLPHQAPCIEGEVEIMHADVCDAEAVSRAVTGCDVVIHCAALVPITRAGRRFWDVNVQGTRNVLNESLRQGVRKVAFISSSSVYGLPRMAPIFEDTPVAPFGEYGKSKAAAEALCQDFKKLGLDISILRPRTILGPGRLGILQLLFERLRLGKPLFILGSGQNRFQLVSAYDMVSACYLVATKPCRNEDFNVGCQEFGSLRGDLEALAAHAGTGCRIVSLPQTPARLLFKLQEVLRLGPFVDYHYHIITRNVWFSTEKIQKSLGWRAKYSNEAALCETYDWYLENRHRVDTMGGSPHLRGIKGRFLSALLKLI